MYLYMYIHVHIPTQSSTCALVLGKLCRKKDLANLLFVFSYTSVVNCKLFLKAS